MGLFMMNSIYQYKPLKSHRLQLRLSPETEYRIRELAKDRHITMTKLLEILVDEEWNDSKFARDYFESFMP